MFLNVEEIIARAAPLAWPVYLYNSIGSTNTEAIRLISDTDYTAPFLVLAEQQTTGKGRRGRKWISPFAQNVYFSLVLQIDGGLQQLEGLSLVVGLAVMHSLRALSVHGAALKWPNDILVGHKKIAGILLELVGNPIDICHIVLGIGINANMQASMEIHQQWTSIQLETGFPIDRNYLIAKLWLQLQDYLTRHKTFGFIALQEEWERNHLWQGKAVSLIADVNQIDGIVLGVDRYGALRLNLDGVETIYRSGELSLRLRDDSRVRLWE
ncbi:Bifunctional ligase/repressor BirA [Candidatus Pseudomonas adelgestsugas]|uniref:Bifunctional ligase/repressor BirA n=1 Tax=Candidatus Pseudomonas adelgestsugas TaxID=1302376 RepID=A0ABX5R7J3_9PSED|nr:biotin--[acetyl-CoA-carboxylase] ligase [Candidatus Pseudomonas adelgestsugas]QAX81617.1 Bifunctional ligase/repressor BirA [Candidatus Pseudomonas adelgestsugas]